MDLNKPWDRDTAVILVDHGSTRAAANRMLEDVATMYRAHSGVRIVEVAHMELAEPSIAQAFEACVVQGASRVVVHPYFLAPGRHSTSDIPALVRDAASRHPGVAYCVTGPLGLDPRMVEVVHSRVCEALDTLNAPVK